MAKHVLILTTVTFALVCGGIPARAQEDSDDPAITRHWEEVQQNQGDEEDTGMMGHGMMRHCMRQCMAEDGRMGEGWRKHGMMRHGGMMGPLAMRIIFALNALVRKDQAEQARAGYAASAPQRATTPSPADR